MHPYEFQILLWKMVKSDQESSISFFFLIAETLQISKKIPLFYRAEINRNILRNLMLLSELVQTIKGTHLTNFPLAQRLAFVGHEWGCESHHGAIGRGSGNCCMPTAG